MGLDVVELVMRVEETFEITIEDEEAEQTATIGQFYALVLRKLGFDHPERCLSSVAFYQTRRALMDVCGTPRRAVAPATALESCLPLADRRSHWQQLGQRLDMTLPELQRPAWVKNGIGLTAVACLLGAVVTRSLAFSPVTWAGLLVSASLLPLAMNRATTRLAVHLPANCATMRQTVQRVMQAKFGVYRQERGAGKQEIWQTLRAVVADELSVDIERVTPEAHIVRDLGAD